MKKAVIVYGSSTGNTRAAAEWIKAELSIAGMGADLYDAVDIRPASTALYDLIIFGSSTWGEGDIQDDFLDFYDEMDAGVLNGKKVAVFGCGDSAMFPDYFCGAVDLIADKAKQCGAKIVAEPFKIDGDVDAYAPEIKKWAGGLA
jgi:flavodoxin short chain